MDATTKSACKKVSFLVALALLCCGAIYHWMGQQAAAEFLGAYLIEFSLSIDNLFVFITDFHRVSNSCCLSAPGIGLGHLDSRHSAISIHLFGSYHCRAIQLDSLHLWRNSALQRLSDVPEKEAEKPVTDHFAYALLKKWLPVSESFDGNRFLTKQNGRWHATPLLAALLVIEGSDLLFAIDSVPAAFSVSTNLFLVYTSNILAILGLRQLYFVLEHLQERFQYVRYGVAIILGFTGIKLLAVMLQIHISIVASISFIVLVLLGSILLSIL